MSNIEYDMTDELMETLQDEGYYDTHCSAMTKEGLHSKMDIIGQLAKRDREISVLKEQFELADSTITSMLNHSIYLGDSFAEVAAAIYEKKLVAIYRRERAETPF